MTPLTMCPGPATLYKYRRLDAQQLPWIRELFEKNRVYFSAVDEFDDPFDSLSIVRVLRLMQEHATLRRESIRSRAHLKLARRPDLRERILTLPPTVHAEAASRRPPPPRDYAGLVGIHSLSGTALSSPLWMRCANAHQGFCLGFRRSCAPFREALPVEYTHSPRDVSDLLTEVERLIFGLFRKSEEWRYEEEWRIVLPERSRQFVGIPRSALTHIVFGARMSPAHRREIRAMAGEHRAWMFDAFRPDKGLQLELRRVQ